MKSAAGNKLSLIWLNKLMKALGSVVEQKMDKERVEKDMEQERAEYLQEQNDMRTKELRIKMAKFL